MIYRIRSGVQSNRLLAEFGDAASIHDTFPRWVRRGVIARLWAVLVEARDELAGVD